MIIPSFTNIQTRILELLTDDYEVDNFTDGLDLVGEDEGHIKKLIQLGYVVEYKNKYKIMLDLVGTPFWKCPYVKE